MRFITSAKRLGIDSTSFQYINLKFYSFLHDYRFGNPLSDPTDAQYC